MKRIWDDCVLENVKVPVEVIDYFDGQYPVESVDTVITTFYNKNRIHIAELLDYKDCMLVLEE